MRTMRPLALLLVAVLAVFSLGGCTSAQSTAMPQPGPRTAPPAKIRLGCLPTEDVLPIWAAQQGMFDKVGLTVQLVEYPTASARDAAFKSGAIDGFVGDTFTVARLSNEGFKSRIVTVCLGTTPAQGRFGIVAAPGSRIRLRSQLQDVPIATSANTMDEFVLDKLMRSATSTWPLTKQYVDSASQRLALLTQDKIKAAELPEPYLSLAIRRHAHLIADDTRGSNLSQTVLAFSDSFLARPDGASAVDRLLGAWDAASSLVNSKRKIYRPLLAEKAKLPPSLRLHYRMNSYPHHQLPTQNEVSAALGWMRGKGLLHAVPTYADITWTP